PSRGRRDREEVDEAVAARLDPEHVARERVRREHVPVAVDAVRRTSFDRVDERLEARGRARGVVDAVVVDRAPEPGELEDVAALGRRRARRPADRLQHGRGHRELPALLDPRVPGHADVGEDRDLLATQPGRTTAAARGEADVLGPRRLAPAPQEARELGAAERLRPRAVRRDGGHATAPADPRSASSASGPANASAPANASGPVGVAATARTRSVSMSSGTWWKR